jgi:cell division protein ZapA
MAKKNDSEVVIGGKVIILSGYESEEYMQKVAAYINGKIAEMEKTDNYRKINSDLKNTLLKLNIADDYFKAKEWAEVMEHDMEAKDNQLYELKRELVSVQMRLEKAEKEAEDLRTEILEYEKKMAKLEAMQIKEETDEE